MKKYIYLALFSLGMLQVSLSHALVYGTNPAEAFISTQIEIPADQKLTNMIINPTFTNEYSQLFVPSNIIKKIQKSLKTSAVNITVELTTSPKYYNLIFTAKNSAGNMIASKTFTSLTNKNRTKIANTVPYVHTNLKYELNHNAYTEIKWITKNPFTVPVNIAK
ncbi:hypothetical protein KBB68_04265 [Candidatus Babeliales bacterium]|nr:hypothetical protein [Candidatus Babeliales bacterium]